MLSAMMLLLVLTPTTPAPAPAPEAAAGPGVIRVVVSDLARSNDVSERLGRIVADNLVAELRKLVGVSVVSMDEVRAMLAAEQDRQELGCDAESSCLSELANALGADFIVGGSIATLGDARVLSLRAIDQQRATVTGQVEERLVLAGGEELLAAIGPAVGKLFPEITVKPGLVRGVSPERARLLNPPPLPVWSTVAVGGLATAALLAAGGALLAANATLTAGQDLVESSRKNPVDGALVVNQEQAASALANAGTGLLIGGAVVAATTGVMALFTDWRGARSQDAGE